MKFIMMTFLVSLSFLVACNFGEDQATSDSTEAIQVEILIPGSIPLAKSTDLSVAITQGAKTVKNADEVIFELWKENDQDNSERIEGKHEKDGLYNIEKNFEEEGIYYVQTHVTAKGMHVMPKLPFIVGTASPEEIVKLESEKQKLGQSGPDQNTSHEHHQ
ncbi:FixH family protein [Oceanobacillus manasiensis]|uniref:FixH family protein n=1 Tax=Oceanobacillus manasiensis TaxID=586413 RepID=UPI0005A90309|nr:FixH family protein [Oceanobacillus manasiensis]